MFYFSSFIGLVITGGHDNLVLVFDLTSLGKEIFVIPSGHICLLFMPGFIKTKIFSELTTFT